MNLRVKIAKDLLEIKAIKIKTDSYFTWASGIQSPIYCDNRVSLSYPAVRDDIVTGYRELLKDYTESDLIAGVATSGIPYASILADQEKMPLCYIRSSAKGHGRQNKIEGDVKGTETAVVIEDLISTGGSSIEAAKSLAETGVTIDAVLAIFTYGFPLAEKNFSENNFTLQTLTNFDTLMEVAQQEGYINSDDVALLMKFSQDPENWIS